MDIKIEKGLQQAPQTQKKSAAGAAKGASFAENLKAAGKRAQTPEAVFEQALSDRENPDLQQLDDYLEGLIQEEMKGRGH